MMPNFFMHADSSKQSPHQQQQQEEVHQRHQNAIVNPFHNRDLMVVPLSSATAMSSPTNLISGKKERKKPIKKRMVVPVNTEEDRRSLVGYCHLDPLGQATAPSKGIVAAARVDAFLNAALARTTSAATVPPFPSNDDGKTKLPLPLPSPSVSSASTSVPTTTQATTRLLAKETPEFVASILKALEVSLELLPKSERRAFDRAVFFKPTIKNDSQFKMLFLRADKYDPQKAAKRMARHYEEKLLLFGESRLTKKITLEDLNPEDIERLGAVGYTMLPVKPTPEENNHDTTVGRADQQNQNQHVWLLNIPNVSNSEAEPDSVCRCTWYQIMATMEDGELSVAAGSVVDSNNLQEPNKATAMMKGVIDVVYCPGNLRSASSPGNLDHRKSSSTPSQSSLSEIISRNAKMVEGLPCRVSKYHLCYNDPRVQSMISSKIGNIDGVGNEGRKQRQEETDKCLINLTKSLESMKQETQIRTIGGTKLDLHYATMPSLGVLYWFNCDADVSMLLKNYYIQHRKAMERKDNEMRLQQESSDKGIILHPQPDDVLVGRGRPYQDFPGNQRLGYYVETNLTKYKEASSRFEKTCIIIDVVQSVQQSGGRFIQKCTANGGNWWIVASDKAAREKTCSAFRTKICKRQQAADSASASASGGAGGADKTTSKKNKFNTAQSHSKATKRSRLDPSLTT